MLYLRRTAILALLLALAGAVLAGLGSARPTQTAKLRLFAVSPLTVIGTGFHTRERTLITATADSRTQIVRITASRLGSFRVKLNQLTPGRCDVIRVVAVGRAGSQVVLKRLPLPACLPERSYG